MINIFPNNIRIARPPLFWQLCLKTSSYPVGTMDFTEKNNYALYYLYYSGFFLFNFVPIGWRN